MKFTILITILILSATIFAQTDSADDPVESDCWVSAYVIDKDPRGLNVRSKPNGRSRKIGKIPFDKDGPMVSITASAGNWVKIKSAWNTEEKDVFSKIGWVYAPLLAISISQNTRETKFVNAYEFPSVGSDVVAKLPVFQEYKLSGCFESWIKVSILKGNQKVDGWVQSEYQCDLANTMC